MVGDGVEVAAVGGGEHRVREIYSPWRQKRRWAVMAGASSCQTPASQTDSIQIFSSGFLCIFLWGSSPERDHEPESGVGSDPWGSSSRAFIPISLAADRAVSDDNMEAIIFIPASNWFLLFPILLFPLFDPLILLLPLMNSCRIVAHFFTCQASKFARQLNQVS